MTADFRLYLARLPLMTALLLLKCVNLCIMNLPTCHVANLPLGFSMTSYICGECTMCSSICELPTAAHKIVMTTGVKLPFLLAPIYNRKEVDQKP